MPPPPSDEEIIKSFTKEEHDAYEWYKKNQGHLSTLNSYEWERFVKLKFPTKEAWSVFYSFGEKWLSRHRKRMSYRMSTAEFIDKVNSTNFTSLDSLSSLNWTLDMLNTPFVHIGTGSYGGTSCQYALRTGGAYLWPNYDQKPWEDNILHYSVLGMNTTVNIEFESNIAPQGSSHKRRQNRSSGEDSVRSTETDDAEDANGFIFVQLGALCRFSGNWEKAISEPSSDAGSWEDTGFGVVAVLDRYGFLGEVMVIYNYFEDFEEANPAGNPDPQAPVFKKEHIVVRDENGEQLHHIGRVHPEADCFSQAVIAKDISMLKTPRSFEFEVKATTEYQIVRVVLRGPFLVRQVVAKNPDKHQSRRFELVQR